MSSVDKLPSGDCVAVAEEETVDQDVHPMSREEEDAQSMMNRRSRSLREFRRMSLLHRFQTTMRRTRRKLNSPDGCEIEDNRLRR